MISKSHEKSYIDQKNKFVDLLISLRYLLYSFLVSRNNNLLKVCACGWTHCYHKIYNNTLDVFLGNCIPTSSVVSYFDATKLQFIKNIIIDRHNDWDMINSLKNLKKLYFDCSINNPINKNELPVNLTYLEFGYHFN